MYSKEAEELYFGRCSIEESFDIIKNKVKIENFTSHKVIGVEQEIVKGQKEGLKYHYKVNTNVMVGILREKLMEIVLSEGEELQKKRDEFIELVKKYLVPIKPGRSFPRKKMHSMNKYRHNLRRNC